MVLVFKLVFDIVRLLLKWVVQTSLLLLGCAVRLLYWSVRAYGWGRVVGFLAALWISLWLHQRFRWLSWSAVSVSTVAIGTLGLWVAFVGGYWLLAHWWQRRTNAYLIQAPAIPPPNAAIRCPEFTYASDTSPVPGGRERKSSLWEQLVSPFLLQQAWQRVLWRGGGPGSDGLTVEAFGLDAERRLQHLAMELRMGRYRPRPPRWVEVPKRDGDTRRLAVLCVQDRIVQQALHLVLAPLWDRHFAPCSYAYRPGRSALQAVAAVEQAFEIGRVWVLDADIASFFDSVPHMPLFRLLDEWLPDPQMRRFVQMCVTAVSPAAGRGLAQGSPLSPLLANLYLHRFDTAFLQLGQALVRYADDFVILCATRQQAEDALRMAGRLLHGLGLRLNSDKTRIVHRDEGFTFLGYLFTKDGKRPTDEALESLQMRLAAASDESTRRQILAGWQGYFGTASALPGTELPAPPDTSAWEVDWMEPWWSEADKELQPALARQVDDSALALYRERFLGRSDAFAQYWQRAERRGYMPVRRPVTDAELLAHLGGQSVLGTYLLQTGGNTKALVLDVDGPDSSEAGQQRAFAVAHQLVGELRRCGITPLWVDSGGKGYHLWVCFRGPVPAKQLRQWAVQWLDRFRPLPEGVLVEVFPKQDSAASGALGSLVRLPLGKHPETGRRSRLLSNEGQPVEDPWAVLAATPFVGPEILVRAAADDVVPSTASLPEPPQPITPIVQGCMLLSALVEKAAQTRHLHHTERLALLYTLGHCGEAGKAYLHQIIALCENYNPRITERWIRRLEEGHRPIRCTKLKEWLKDYLPGVECPCIPRISNPSPLDWLRTSRQPSPPTTARNATSEWAEVAQEMFGETLLSDDEADVQEENDTCPSST